MTRPRFPWLLSALALAWLPALAAAQDEPAPEGDDTITTETTPADDGLGENDETDRYLIQDDPSKGSAVTAEDLMGRTAKKAGRPTKADYPIEVVKRPLTLTAMQGQVSLEATFAGADDLLLPRTGTGSDNKADSPVFTQVLRGAFGVTQDLQVGVTYGIGMERLSPAEGDKGFVEGRAFSLDAGYTIIPGWLAAQLSVPFYVSPFAMGVTVGAPFRVVIREKNAIFGGHDLVQIRLKEFPVDPADVAYNTRVREAVEKPVANLNINLGALHEFKPNLTGSLQLGYRMIDMSSADAPVSLLLGLIWSKDARFDLGFQAGVLRLDDFGGSFTATVMGAYRL